MMSTHSPGRNDRVYRSRPFENDSFQKNTFESQRTKQEDKSSSAGYTEFFSWGNDEEGQLGHG